MKYLTQTLIWTVVSFIIFVAESTRIIEADEASPAEFAHLQPNLAEISNENLSPLKAKNIKLTDKKTLIPSMTDARITEILTDYLDFFPLSEIPALAKHILFLCNKYRFDPAFILSLIQVESGFKIGATSPVGAIGLMQLMLPTAKHVVRVFQFPFSDYEKFEHQKLRSQPLTVSILRDPFVNTTLGIAYLAWLRDRYKGSTFHSVAAYNVGPSKMDGWLSQKSFHPVETQKYFDSILRRVPLFQKYRRSARSARSIRLRNIRKIRRNDLNQV